MGSPPQVRGKPLSASTHRRVYRITPAGAGKTPLIRHPAGAGRDHPRRCGENGAVQPHQPVGGGSPPQVRGKLFVNRFFAKIKRITPAGAGKTATPRTRLVVSRDHPRRCGENTRALADNLDIRGSPPQVRGKPCCFTFPMKGSGITPAGAGKTRSSRNAQIVNRDHPRRCGENSVHSSADTCRMGSPPQVRGKRQKEIARAVHGGITPAGAGKTLWRRCR